MLTLLLAKPERMLHWPDTDGAGSIRLVYLDNPESRALLSGIKGSFNDGDGLPTTVLEIVNQGSLPVTLFAGATYSENDVDLVSFWGAHPIGDRDWVIKNLTREVLVVESE